MQLSFSLSILTLIVINLITQANSSAPNKRPRRSITRLHDTLVYQKNQPKTGVNKSRRESPTPPTNTQKHYKTLPAHDALRHKYFSEKVEDELGHIKIQRLRRNEANNNAPPPAAEPVAEDPPAPEPAPEEPPIQPQLLDKQRVQDLEQVFRILAQRNGPLLEQMLSLRDAIDRFYGIFEFMGVAKMPPAQQNAAIKKILERTLNIDTEKAAKRFQ